ncbi:HAD-IC family P-type ATPase [Methylocystis sp.]
MDRSKEPLPSHDEYWSKGRIQAFARLAATLAGIYVCALLWAPFLSTLTLAVTLAILFVPAHELIEQRLKSSNLAAAASVLVVAFIVVAPMFFVGERLFSEAANNADYVQRQIASSDWRQLIGKHRWTAALSQWIQNEIDPGAIVSRLASWLTNTGAAFLRRSTAGLISILITFYALFYMLRDRREAVAMVKALSPLAEAETDLIVTRVEDTVYAIVYGTLAVAAVQGALAGLMFWWLDLPAPLLWGLVMGLLSIVPVLGAFIVWIPASIVLALDGNWEKAIILSAWGGLVVGSVDNLLRPLLMGGRLKIHTFTTFISLLGGLNLFGAPGMILGPVAMTVTIALLGLWRASDIEAEEATQGAPLGPRTEKPWHCASPKEALERLGVSAKGLSTAKALQLRAAYGLNTLKETKPIRPWAILLAQFNSILIWILIAASVVSGFLGEAIDAVVILAIVFLNAVVGFYQEFSAEKSIAVLMRMTAPQAKVWRDGAVTTIAAADVVPGDILELAAGDIVAADARLLEAASLACVEAALTGESEAVDKNAQSLDQADLPLGDRKNMIFMGTSVATGSGRAVVVATAMQTQFGAIASLLEEAGDETGTPLQQRLEAFGRVLLWATLGTVSLLFGLGLWRGGDVKDLFMTSVSLAVAAIPESLPAVVTAALSLGVMRMSRRRALVRRLASVETLGSTNVICTDKTGTLTVGQMTVRRLFVAGRDYEVTGEGYGPEGDIRFAGEAIDPSADAALKRFGEILVGCNNARFDQEDGAWTVIGDPTEGALLAAGQKAGADRDKLDETQPKIFEIPFDSNRKLHSLVRRRADDGLRVLTNGAPEILLGRCSHILDDSGVRPITALDREAIARQNADFASRALRVLGSAFRDLEPISVEGLGTKAIECNLVFVGLSGLYDPPRPEAKDAIAKCRSAGVRVVVITGDHPHTAKAIGRELGLGFDGRILSGPELEKMTDDALAEEVAEVTTYARVSAEHKLRIIRAWQANEAVVAMTGDGVNDAPAIKGADIGVAMGRTGTEVTKQASDMIITDDNFATIVAAIEEGRGIYENIRKTLLYLLACNSGELLLMTICILIGLPAPLLPIHLLWINLVTDGPPALCLAADHVDPSVMGRRPRERDKDIADEEFFWTMLMVAVPTAVVAFGAYAYGLQYANLEVARTYAFMAMIFTQLFASLSLRSQKPIWRESFLSNTSLLIVVVVSVAAQMLIQQTEFFASLLKAARIPIDQAITLLAVSALSLLVFEIFKLTRPHFAEGRTDGRSGIGAASSEGAPPLPRARFHTRKEDGGRVTARELNFVRGSAIGAVALMAVVGGSLYWLLQQTPDIDRPSEKEERPIATRWITASGVVSPESVRRVTAPIAGVIEAFYCNVGDKVKAGQLCAKLDERPYKAAVERAKASLAAAKTNLQKSSSQATRAKSAFLRQETLAKRNAAMRRKLDRYRKTFERAVATTKRDEELISRFEAELRAAEAALEQTKIASPIDGTVAMRPLRIGDKVGADAAGTQLFVVALPDARIEAKIGEKDVDKFKIGEAVSVTVESMPNHNFEGTVTTIRQSSETAPDNKTYSLFVSASNPDALLMPSMGVTVQIAADRETSAWPSSKN